MSGGGNPNHDPKTGEFSSGDGGGPVGHGPEHGKPLQHKDAAANAHAVNAEISSTHPFMRIGTSHFVSLTKARDYYRGQGNDNMTNAELDHLVHTKITEGDIHLGKPTVPAGGKLVMIDAGARYGIETGRRKK